jgi:hypothetical protein
MVDQKQYAATAWDYAVSICIRNTTGAEQDALIQVEERPTIEDIRAVLAVGRCKPWLPLIESALVEIGIAALEGILRETDRA